MTPTPITLQLSTIRQLRSLDFLSSLGSRSVDTLGCPSGPCSILDNLIEQRGVFCNLQEIDADNLTCDPLSNHPFHKIAFLFLFFLLFYYEAVNSAAKCGVADVLSQFTC